MFMAWHHLPNVMPQDGLEIVENNIEPGKCRRLFSALACSSIR